MDDLSKALAFEVKKEIADRYFGFRKIIEDDTKAYLEKIAATALQLKKKISPNFARIYSLLYADSIINDFHQLTQLDDNFFYLSYVKSSSSARKSLFDAISCRGLTGKKRYMNLFYDMYYDLHAHLDVYHDSLVELQEEYEVICEQINIFYRKNDIDMIMQFFRNIDCQNNLNHTSQNSGTTHQQNLDKKLRILPPIPAKLQLPQIPKIPDLIEIKSKLNKILTRSYQTQPNLDPKKF